MMDVTMRAAEAADLLGAPVTTLAEAMAVARMLHARGVRQAVLTLGAEGAVGVDGRSGREEVEEGMRHGASFSFGRGRRYREGQAYRKGQSRSRLPTPCGTTTTGTGEWRTIFVACEPRNTRAIGPSVLEPTTSTSP